MQILVQHIETGFYWGSNGGWVEAKPLALDFKTSLAALEFCNKKKLTKVEIVLCFDESVWDIRLQVSRSATSHASM